MSTTPSAAINPSKYTVVATDMDGTICETTFIHETTHEAVKKLRENNILVLPVTGRGPCLAQAILKPLSLPPYPAGYHHGALTYDAEGNVILNKTISMDVINALIVAVDRMVKERGVYASVIAQCKDAKFFIYEPENIQNSTIATRWDMATVVDGKVIPSAGVRERGPGRTANLGDMTEDDFQQIYQATLLNAAVEPSDVVEWQKQVIKETFEEKNITGVKTHASGRYFIDTIHEDSDKAHALEALGAKMGFECKDILALGDNQNDIGMLKVAGKSVAMGNARDDVKSHADFVTTHIKEGGWAHAIDQFIFVD